MKKILYFFILLFVFAVKVNANEVTLVKERIGDIYTNYYDSNLGKNRFLYTNKYLFGNNYGYCLELGKSIDSNIYTYSTSFDSLNISDSDLNYIKLVSYYGYDYPSHQTDRYYMAAQELIWNRLSLVGIKWVDGPSFTNVIYVNEERSEISRLVDMHNVKPSFGEKTYKIIRGEDLILNDKNNVLSEYYTDNKSVTIDGDNLIIDGSIVTSGDIIFKRKKYTDKSFFVYTNGTSQKMMSSGSVPDVISTIAIEVISGSVSINKYDSETKEKIPLGEANLNGAEYGLYDLDNNLIDIFITGKKEKIDNLAFGKYYIKEIKSSPGYLLDDNIYYIEINNDNKDINLDVYEDVIKRKVELFKVYDNNTTGILAGEIASFEIYDKNNNLIDTITTDDEGYASIILPYGKYTFKQISGDNNYYMVDDFDVDIYKYDERSIYKLLSDSEITSFVKVIKKDIDTLNNIVNSNIRFKIFDVNNNCFVTFNVTYPEVKIVDEFYVNDDGIFITPEPLPSGKYILYEVDDYMDGYLYNKEGLSFTIDASSNIVNDKDLGILLELEFYNKRVKGNININKYGEDIIYKNNSYYYKEIFLNDVFFELYASSDIYENNKLIYNKDDLVKKIITDDGGEAHINNLPLGDYYLIETASNNNNIVSSDRYDIKLEYKDQYTSDISYDIDIYNELPKGKLIINKFDSKDNSRLSNTLIEIRNSDNIVIYNGYTDNNGQVIIDDLLYGDYYLSEIEASSGYRILEDNINFSIDKNEIEINVYNDRIEVPNTGYNSMLNIIALGIIVFSIIVVIIFYEKKIVVIISSLFLLLSSVYSFLYFYNYISSNYKNTKAINLYLDNKIDDNYEERYKYNSVLDIPSVSIRRGILDIDNGYNDAKYNIELLREDNSIILASHNGNEINSYFGNLNNINLGDVINYYKDGKIYKYIYSDSYDIKKNGYADIYYDHSKKSIILITCKDNVNDGQRVFVGYLESVESY